MANKSLVEAHFSTKLDVKPPPRDVDNPGGGLSLGSPSRCKHV